MDMETHTTQLKLQEGAKNPCQNTTRMLLFYRDHRNPEMHSKREQKNYP
ncbi:hypothetical protein DFP92_102372 [Yoonia sediminilitoris]|uniref:Uncharacterized protein n=1 Tax=Yoonia sediminilitoris TaxID=1286148 RepID=A0A2T6KMB8_9RHOB|nr:hypothetical protein C8N45_102372 [Yoonia sediminilitoris]RCW97655.1 hypothetical protein DFP92_102372 [Yoonia sediminilitoris]